MRDVGPLLREPRDPVIRTTRPKEIAGFFDAHNVLAWGMTSLVVFFWESQLAITPPGCGPRLRPAF
jgi:hypothetical protein